VKERQDQAKDNADNDAGDDWEIKRRVTSFDPNIAGQTSQPLWGKAAPEEKTDQRRDDSNDEQEFPDVAHLCNL
jgi:hypothetical protein